MSDKRKPAQRGWSQILWAGWRVNIFFNEGKEPSVIDLKQRRPDWGGNGTGVSSEVREQG